jgi:hypothetical protein
MSPNDPGPVPDILKREPPKPLPQPTKQQEPPTPGDLSTPELVKAINEEYSLVLAAERNNLPKALAIGEKLTALRQRVKKYGEWQTKLKEWCPKISYETATLYIRLFERQDDWRAAAAAKSVEPTDLTIDDVRQLLAKPRATTPADSESDDDSDDEPDSRGKPTPEAMEARQAANAEAEAKAQAAEDQAIAKQHIEEVWDADELVDVVLEVRDVDYLKAVMIAALKKVDASFLKELAMELQKALDPRLPPRPPAAPPAGVVTPTSDVVARRV